MKRFFALLSTLGLLLALAACGPAAESPAPTDTTPPPTESMVPTPSPEESMTVETPEATPPQESLPPEETEEPAEQELPVSADYADEDLLSRPEDYDLLLLDESEYRVDVAITSTETVTDIQVVSIPMDDMGYRVDAVLGTLDAIAPGRPFVVAMAFPGDMPNTALVFTDSDGAVHYCAIAMSGKDGSLLLIPFEPVSD
ncbi:hypothetical protein [Pseudoflavonifractor sp.]|jgi:hypothetical protein|uniref:hypothetical protein n=1 Tax=Pseudoflavonifractor sp. TaxID=1980281 RepID=UPI003D8C07DB